MRRPNPSAVTNLLLKALISPPASQSDDQSKYHDVILRTSDNHEIPAYKSILALRSSFFSRLFYAPFSESTSSTVAVDIPKDTLIEVLHFIYSDDSPVLRRVDNAVRKARGGSKPRRKAWASLHCRDIEATVAIVAAADFCQIAVLAEWGCSLIMKAIRVKRGLTCIALEAIVSCRGVCGKLAEVQVALLKYIVRYIPGCFAAHDVAMNRSLAERECFGYGGKCALMHLGEDSMRILFNSLKECNSEWLCTAVLFDALYFWASGGQRIDELDLRMDAKKASSKDFREGTPDKNSRDSRDGEEGAKCKEEDVAVSDIKDTAVETSSGVKNVDSSAIDKTSSRWKTAMACAAMMKAPNSSYLVSLLEPSGLLSQGSLYKYYRDVTLRTAALENQPETGYSTAKVTSADGEKKAGFNEL